jgi:hypothetical protein
VPSPVKKEEEEEEQKQMGSPSWCPESPPPIVGDVWTQSGLPDVEDGEEERKGAESPFWAPTSPPPASEWRSGLPDTVRVKEEPVEEGEEEYSFYN